MPSHDFESLERRIGAVRSCFRQLSGSEDLEELIKIIHGPGWTTPAEHGLVAMTLDSMLAHGQTLINTQQQLLAASREVGSKQAVAAS